MAQLIKKASKGASIYINGTKKDLTPEQWDAFKAEFGNNPEMISYFTDENNTSSFRMNDNGTITVNGMPLSTDSRKRRAKRTDDANTEKLYNFFNGLNTVVKGKNIAKYSGDYNLGYDSSEDGKVYTLNRSAVNANAMNRLDALMNFDPNNLDDIEGFENFSDKESLRNYIDQHIRPNYEYLKAALTNGATKDDFNKYKDIFNSIGIYADKKSSNSEGNGTNSTAGTSAEIMDDHIVHDGNGGFRFKDDTINAFMNSDAMKEYVGKNLWLNKEFVDWAAKNHGVDFSWITPGTGLFRINGKWIDGSKINGLTGHDKLAFDNWVKHNKETVNGDNSMIVQYWGTNAPYQKYVQNPDIYFNGIDEGTTFIDDTGNYVTPNGERVFLVADKDYLTGDNYDAFGHLLRNGLRTVVLDADTNLLKDFDISTLRRRDLSNADDLEAYQKYYSGGTKGIEYLKTNLNNVNLKLLKGSDFKGGGFGLLYDPIHKRYYWKNNNFRENNRAISGPLSELDTSSHAIEIDPRLAKWISENWDKIVNDKLQYKIDSVARTPFLRDISYRWSKGDLPGFDPGDWTFELGGRSFGAHGGNFLLYDPKKAKELGHILEIIPSTVAELHQHGGVLAAQKMVAGKLNNTESPVPLREVGKEKIIGDGTDLTAADWAEIAALGADVASLGASFIPGANVFSAGIGAAGSVTDFVAQATKDGLDWGDIGRFALNLGLDAATLIPVAGGAAKAAKTAKLIKQSKPLAKWIGVIASSLGTGSGLLTAYENVINGDDWTIEDIRTIVNGVRGFTNLNRLKGSSVKKGKVTNNSKGTIGNGDNSIQITKKEYDDIMALPKDQQAKKMAGLIKSKTENKDLFERVRTKEEADIKVKELGEKPTGADELKNFEDDVKKIQEEKIEKSAEEILKEFDIKLNKQKAETTWNPKTWDFWHRGGVKGGLEFKPEADTYWSPTRPKNWDDLGWRDRAKWAWNRRTAIRDAKWNKDNPYYKKKWGERYVADSDDSGYQSYLLETPVALNYYNNLIPWFTRDENVRESIPTASYYDNTPLYLSYKKGGKVLKGQNGISDILNAGNNAILEAQRKAAEEAKRRHDLWTDFEVDAGTRNARDYLSGLASDLEDGELSSPTRSQTANGPVITDSIREKAKAGLQSGQARATATTMSNSNDAFRSTFGNSRLQNETKNTSPTTGGSNTTKSKLEFPNLGKTLVDAARFAIGAIGINATAKAKANAIKKSKVEHETPMLSGPRFNNSSVDHMSAANRNRIAMQRMLIPQTSDSTKKFAMQQAISSAENDLRTQENMAYSQNISQFNRLNNEFQNNYAKLRTEIANKNRQEAARVNSALEMNEASRREQMYTHLVQPLVQMSGNYAQYNKTKADAENMMNQLEAKNAYDIETRLAYDEAKARLKIANPDLSGDALNEAIYNDLTYKDAMDRAKRKYLQNSSKISYLNPITNAIEYSSPTLSNPSGSTIIGEPTYIGYKKGGKMSASEKRDLENMKHSHKVHLETIKALIKDIQKHDEYLYKTLLKIVK